ncbi:hypothetical protein ETAA8_26560 [Anatilimnocola aggregata]|uniref:Uncharacterized protein n=1 Tax=Anatilimnocola aggregata TaxID=2528021 RepID=A0A517YBF3_9BACT|nr:hypothetical protein [Anatilimnocola aggregata]QDU27568.1 hypothetical protein ETAA8_26560 [Anatilimnocola aggregata]
MNSGDAVGILQREMVAVSSMMAVVLVKVDEKSSLFAARPLTPALSPEYRGEGVQALAF